MSLSYVYQSSKLDCNIYEYNSMILSIQSDRTIYILYTRIAFCFSLSRFICYICQKTRGKRRKPLTSEYKSYKDFIIIFWHYKRHMIYCIGRIDNELDKLPNHNQKKLKNLLTSRKTYDIVSIPLASLIYYIARQDKQSICNLCLAQRQ